MGSTEQEVRSQPATWREAVVWVPQWRAAVPHGERTAFIGCGTSWFVAQAVAALREGAGHGESDAFAASEAPLLRGYDRVVAISRSGTTTEVARALGSVPPGTPRVAVVAVDAGAVAAAADVVVELAFADENSVVQTRFATTVIALARAAGGEDIEGTAAAAEEILAQSARDGGLDMLLACQRFVFLGRGWSVGLAHEAALKLREAALATTESYPALEYRHGPMALAGAGTAVWILGDDDSGVATEIALLGATVVVTGLDPLVDLVKVHLLALALARRGGLDPDQPRNLSRSVILNTEAGRPPEGQPDLQPSGGSR